MWANCGVSNKPAIEFAQLVFTSLQLKDDFVDTFQTLENSSLATKIHFCGVISFLQQASMALAYILTQVINSIVW